MATLSKKKREYISKNINRASVEEIAERLGVSEAEVKREVRRMGIKTEDDRGEYEAGRLRPHSIKWTAAVTILAALFTALIYGRALNYGFVFDDHHAILDNVPLHYMSNFSKAFTDPTLFSNQPGRRMYRPIVTATYILNYVMFGEKPGGWRVLNLFLHAFNGVLLFLLLDLFISRRLVSAIIAIIFISHPAASEAVQFIAARSTLMAAFFVLITFYCFVAWTVERRRGWLIGGAVALAIGLLCKENVIMMLAIIPIIYWAKMSATLGETFSRAAWKGYLPFIIVGVLFLLMRKWGFDLNTAVLSRTGRPIYVQLLTQAKVWWIYFASILWPINLNVYRNIDMVRSGIIQGAGIFGQPVLWVLGWVAVAALVIIGRKNRMAFLGAAFAVIILIPETVTALNLLSADRRIYMPLAGAALIAASPFWKKDEKGNGVRFKALFGLISAALFCYVVLSIFHIPDWRTEKALFEASIRNTPKAEISWHGLAYVFAQEHELRRAEWCLHQSLSLRPNYAASLRLLAAIYIEQNRNQDALGLLQKAVRIEPMSQRGWYNLGLAQMNLGIDDEAEKSFIEAIRQDAYYHQPHNNLGIIYQKKGRYAEAVREFAEAVRLDPENQRYQLNLKRSRELLNQMPQPSSNPGYSSPPP